MISRLILLALTALATLGCWATTPLTPARQLIGRMQRLQKQGVMVGHQDDPVYGRSWHWDEGRSDVRDLVGSYPAVMGFDLGMIELDSTRNLDGVPFERMRREIVAQHERGGIVTLSWHPRNPVTGESAWTKTPGMGHHLAPGGAYHEKMCGWIDRVAAFVGSLRRADGTPVPVVFRPWHEMSGDWFWWGTASMTATELQDLYRLTHDRLTRHARLTNVVWAYSPNLTLPDSEQHYMSFYPGDEYVDLMGIDIYDFDHDDAAYTRHLRDELSLLAGVGRKHGKLVALTETGAQTLPNARWFTQVFWPVARQFPISYVLFWRNAWDNDKELYISYPGHATAPDFTRWTRYRRVLLARDLRRR